MRKNIPRCGKGEAGSSKMRRCPLPRQPWARIPSVWDTKIFFWMGRTSFSLRSPPAADQPMTFRQRSHYVANGPTTPAPLLPETRYEDIRSAGCWATSSRRFGRLRGLQRRPKGTLFHINWQSTCERKHDVEVQTQIVDSYPRLAS